jgi:heavy metal sensor kinase
MENPHGTFTLGLDLDSYTGDQQQIRRGILWSVAASLLFIAGGGYLVAQRALRPVQMLGATAERVTGKGLNERIPLSHEDAEFQRVINVFNDMLGRLEKNFHQATRFSADAAHELKTPLTILQGSLEEGVQQAPSGSREQQRYADLLSEVQRLKTIVRKLLLLSLADAGQLKITMAPVDLSHMIEEICEDMAVLAPKIRIEKRITPNIEVVGDADLLRQVVQNLGNNAIQHNVRKGRVRVKLSAKETCIVLKVSNTGHDIPEAHRERIFERFHRVDKSRTRAKGGAGLGLSIAREIARSHGGDLTVDPSPPGVTTFTFTLPK